MWQRLGIWSDKTNTRLNAANDIPANQYEQIRERIRHCLDDNYDDNEVDQTLNLMRDETERWNNVETQEDYNDYLPSMDWKLENIDETVDPMKDELLGYCLRLERNNAYLTQLIDKFEQVSFKKKYSELLAANKKLENEYGRLKSTNSKVYTSYCDLLEENKLLKKTNKELTNKLSKNEKESEGTNGEVEKLVKQMEKLKKENEENKQILKDYRKSKMKIQKEITDKENEILKLKGENIATKLKLERIENLVLKQNPSSLVSPQIEYETEDPIKPDEPVEEDDTIALLQQKYKTKTMV